MNSPNVELDVASQESHAAASHSFFVHDAATANWVVRKILNARRYAQQVRDWAAAELHRAEKEEQRVLFRFGSQLERWTEDELRRRGGRRRSLSLPAGKVGFRTSRPTVSVTSERQAIEWCKENLPSALRVSVRASNTTAILLMQRLNSSDLPAEVTIGLAKSQIAESIASTGEVPPGVEVKRAEDNFFIA